MGRTISLAVHDFSSQFIFLSSKWDPLRFVQNVSEEGLTLGTQALQKTPERFIDIQQLLIAKCATYSPTQHNRFYKD